VNYADEIGPEDHVFESNGVEVVVDVGSLVIVSGTEIDFVKTGLNESFQFNNPKTKNTVVVAKASVSSFDEFQMVG
jgi:iron-sulfur cluster assembly protein